MGEVREQWALSVTRPYTGRYYTHPHLTTLTQILGVTIGFLLQRMHSLCHVCIFESLSFRIFKFRPIWKLWTPYNVFEYGELKNAILLPWKWAII